MDLYYRYLTVMLNASMNDCPIGLDDFDYRDLNLNQWIELFNLARTHSIETMLLGSIDMELITHPQVVSYLSYIKFNNLKYALHQKKQIQILPELLTQFQQEGIDFILLKGITLFPYYKNPDARKMADLDLLVLPKDIKCASLVIKKLGYRLDTKNSSSKDLVYEHDTFIRLELHHQLFEEFKIQNRVYFEKLIWEKAFFQEINSLSIKGLNPSHLFIYLIMHMASHLKSKGFGLKQLCDIAYMLKHAHLDLSEIKNIAGETEIDVFLNYILLLIKKFFDIPIPEELLLTEESPDKDREILEALCEDIFISGAYGNHSKTFDKRNNYLMNVVPSLSDTSTPIKSRKQLMFPPHHLLSYHYKYAKNHPLLLPIAWIHRFIRLIFRKDLSLSDTYHFLELDNLTKKRLELLKALKLL